jgi:transposase-like protein
MSERGLELWAKWRRLVSEQVESGQSVAAFCRERELTASQLFAWKKRLRDMELAKFVEVKVVPSKEPRQAQAPPGKAIEIRLDRGCSLLVEPGFDANHLRTLLGVLDSES